jgi:dolichyl-phosphate-mannose--protein O-mannosyl transferase
VGEDAGVGTCTGTENCSSAITALGNPFIWWAAAIAAVYLAVRYFLNIRSSRLEGTILLGIAAGYLPWLMYMNRTVFQFYSIAFFPWMVLILIQAMRTILAECREERVLLWRRLIASFVVLCAVMSIWLSNIWLGYQTTYNYWFLHMWIPAWI